MSEKMKVLLVGWNPDVVDYSKWPGLTQEKLRAGLNGDKEKLNTLNYDVTLGLINSKETAVDDLTSLLTEITYDCVLIGAGVRTDVEHILLFELIINTVHQHAPKAKICFNTGPFDSVDAIKRWM